jgi:ABC-type antimicrobial peptide transport system permease subunit
MNVWDTIGQEKYRSFTNLFFKNANIVILVYDITNKKSFEEIKNYWYKETLDNITNKDVILALIGNKTDLYENEQVSDEEGKKFAKQINAIFKTTSALSNIGINWLFENLGKKISQKFENSSSSDNSSENEKLQKDYSSIEGTRLPVLPKLQQKPSTKLSNFSIPTSYEKAYSYRTDKADENMKAIRKNSTLETLRKSNPENYVREVCAKINELAKIVKHVDANVIKVSDQLLTIIIIKVPKIVTRPLTKDEIE